MTLAENPATALAQLLIRREGGLRSQLGFAWAAAALLWVGSLAVVGLCADRPGDVLPIWLRLAPTLLLGLLMLSVAILGRWDREAALLLTFQRGGCLDEILGTRVTPAALVDGLAGNSIRRIGTLMLPFLAFSGLSVPMWAWTAEEAGVWATSLSVLLLLGVGVVAGSYLALANAALTLEREDRSVQSLRTLVVATAVGIPFVGAMVGLAIGDWGFPVAVGLGAVWAAAVSRGAAIWALRRGGSLPGSLRWLDLSRLLRPRRPNPWVRAWSDNPIVGREAARESHRVPLGMLGAFLGRGGLGLMAGMGALAVLAANGGLREEVVWVGLEVILGILALVLYCGCATRALDLVVSEHEAKTLPQLLATPLTAGELAAGVVSVASRPPLLQYGGLVVPLLLGALLSEGAASPALLPEAMLPVLAALVGAWLGLQAAASAPIRQRAMARSGNLGGLWLIALVAVLIGSVHLLSEIVAFRVVYVASMAAVGLVALAVCRRRASRALSHRPVEGVVGLAPGT